MGFDISEDCKSIKLTLVISELQAAFLLSLVRHQAKESKRLRQFVAHNGPGEVSAGQVSVWEEIAAIVAAGLEEARVE